MRAVLLHFGGVGTYTAATTIAVMFVLIFAISFGLGPLPEGRKRMSWPWAAAWLKASLPRLVITGLFCGGLFLASSLSGSSGANSAVDCSRPLAPLSSAPVTADRLTKAIGNLRLMADAATAGDVTGAQAHFFGDTHNVTHDIDPPLRQVDAALGTQLCEKVVSLENELVGSQKHGQIASDGTATASLLDEAGRKLGLVQ